MKNICCNTDCPYREPLTGREMEVLQLISEGYNNTEIAQKLITTTHTAKAHVSNIIRRLNATDRTTAAVIAVRKGII